MVTAVLLLDTNELILLASLMLVAYVKRDLVTVMQLSGMNEFILPVRDHTCVSYVELDSLKVTVLVHTNYFILN